MSIKSILPLAATATVATLALTGCTQNNAAPADSSATQAPAASAPAGSAPAGSGEASATQAPAPSSTPSAPAAQDNSGALTVDESNQHLTIPAGTTKVIINGSNNHIEGGELTDITVNGSNNAIEVDSASSVSFTGSNNELEYKKGNAPRVANDIGANNVVSQD
ncbi:DUF3060 domain-containing protein [Actinomyces sp.]